MNPVRFPGVNADLVASSRSLLGGLINNQPEDQTMKISNVLLFCFAAVLIGSCQTAPQRQAAAIPIAPRQPKDDDTWCNYNIKEQIGNCGARTGKTICLLCKDFADANGLCRPKLGDPPLRVSPAQGREWELIPLAQGQQQCEDCRAERGATYQKALRPGVVP